MISKFMEIVALYPNFVATAFGFIAISVSGFFGWLLKRPLAKQAASVDLFKAQLDGYERVVKMQAERISYLEVQENVRIAYEDELIRQLRALQGFPFAGKPE